MLEPIFYMTPEVKVISKMSANNSLNLAALQS